MCEYVKYGDIRAWKGKNLTTQKLRFPHRLRLLHELPNHFRKRPPLLHHQRMSLALTNHPLHSSLFPTQLLHQYFSMRYCNHLINSPMHHHDSLSPHLVSQFFELLGALVMPSSGKGLAHETLACEAFGILTFLDFLRCKAVAVRGESSFGVRLGEPFWAEEAGFDVGDLDVEGFGDTGVIGI